MGSYPFDCTAVTMYSHESVVPASTSMLIVSITEPSRSIMSMLTVAFACVVGSVVVGSVAGSVVVCSVVVGTVIVTVVGSVVVTGRAVVAGF